MNKHLVIMAGGVGSRFWPMSRPENPKQFIDVLGVGKTLLQLTVDRFGKDFDPSHIWIVTSADYLNKVKEQLPDVPTDNILLEPCMRNTAPCIGYVAWKIKKKYPDATLAISPADHFVVDTNEFRRCINAGIDFVKGTSRVLTLGMKPTRPDTGYGYIQSGNPVNGTKMMHVQAFREKPDYKTALQYCREGNYNWNAGIFIWDVATVEAAIRMFEPEMASLFDQMYDSFYSADEQATVNKLFPQCNKISIDYAVMERLAGKNIELAGQPSGVFVMPSDFGWSDLGTWGSLYAQTPKDDNNNAVIGTENVSLIESTDCIVRTSGDIKLVLQGLDGYIVAEDNKTILVCKKNQEQRIKEFSETITKQ